MAFIHQLIEKKNILILDTATHKEVIDKLLEMIKDSTFITDSNVFKDAIWEREKIVSTGIGLGLAIPHARKDVVKNFLFSAILIKNGVEWKSIDDKPVKFAILVGSPQDTHKEYLQLLAQIVLFWKDVDKRKKVLEAKTADEIYEILKNSDL